MKANYKAGQQFPIERSVIFGDIPEKVIRGNNLTVFSIQQNEVYQRDYSRIEKLFNTLQRCGKDACQKIILSFAFDDDAREIYEIPEIKNYLNELLRKAPHMFYWVIPQDVIITTIAGVVGMSKNYTTKKVSYGIDIPQYLKIAMAITDGVCNYASTLNDAKGAEKAVGQILPLIRRFS